MSGQTVLDVGLKIDHQLDQLLLRKHAVVVNHLLLGWRLGTVELGKDPFALAHPPADVDDVSDNEDLHETRIEIKVFLVSTSNAAVPEERQKVK